MVSDGVFHYGLVSEDCNILQESWLIKICFRWLIARNGVVFFREIGAILLKASVDYEIGPFSHSYFVVTSVHPGHAETVILDIRKMLTYIATEFTHENSLNGKKA